jgi:hypothetical protein
LTTYTSVQHTSSSHQRQRAGWSMMLDVEVQANNGNILLSSRHADSVIISIATDRAASRWFLCSPCTAAASGPHSGCHRPPGLMHQDPTAAAAAAPRGGESQQHSSHPHWLMIVYACAHGDFSTRAQRGRK